MGIDAVLDDDDLPRRMVEQTPAWIAGTWIRPRGRFKRWHWSYADGRCSRQSDFPRDGVRGVVHMHYQPEAACRRILGPLREGDDG